MSIILLYDNSYEWYKRLVRTYNTYMGYWYAGKTVPCPYYYYHYYWCRQTYLDLANEQRRRALQRYPQHYYYKDFIYPNPNKKTTKKVTTYTLKSAAKHNQTIDPSLVIDDQHIQKYGIIFHVDRDETSGLVNEIYVWVNHGDKYDYSGATDKPKNGNYGKLIGKKGFAVKLKIDPETQKPVSSEKYTLLKKNGAMESDTDNWIEDKYATYNSLPLGSYIKMNSDHPYDVVIEEDDDINFTAKTYTKIDGINVTLNVHQIYKIYNKQNNNFYVLVFNEEYGFSEMVEIPATDLTTIDPNTEVVTTAKFSALQKEPSMVSTPSLMPFIAYNRITSNVNNLNPSFKFAIANTPTELASDLINNWKYVGVFQKYNEGSSMWDDLGTSIFGDSVNSPDTDFKSQNTDVTFTTDPSVVLQNGKYRFGVKAVFVMSSPNLDNRESDFRYVEFEIAVPIPSTPSISVVNNKHSINNSSDDLIKLDPKNFDADINIEYLEESFENGSRELIRVTKYFTGEENHRKPLVWEWDNQSNPVTFDVTVNITSIANITRQENFFNLKHNIFSVNSPVVGETYEIIVKAKNTQGVYGNSATSKVKIVDTSAPSSVTDLKIDGENWQSQSVHYKSNSNQFVTVSSSGLSGNLEDYIENDTIYYDTSSTKYTKLLSDTVVDQTTSFGYIFSKNANGIVLNTNIELQNISEFAPESTNTEIGTIVGFVSSKFSILTESQLKITTNVSTRYRVVSVIKDNNNENTHIGLQQAEYTITTANIANSNEYTWSWFSNASKWKCTLSKKINIKASGSHVASHFVLENTNDNDEYEVVGTPTTVRMKRISFKLESNNLYKLSVVAMDDAGNESSAVESMIYLVEDTDKDGVLDANEYFSHNENFTFKESYLKNETIKLEHNELKKHYVIEILSDWNVFDTHHWKSITISPNPSLNTHTHVNYAFVDSFTRNNDRFVFSYLGKKYTGELSGRGTKWQIIGSPTLRVPIGVTDSSLHSMLSTETEYNSERRVSGRATLKLLWKFNGSNWNQTNQTIIENYDNDDLTQEQLKSKFVVAHSVNRSAYNELNNLSIHSEVINDSETIYYTLISDLALGTHNFKIFTKNVSNDLLSAEHNVDVVYTIDQDADGDGILDSEDAFPDDAETIISNEELADTSKWYQDNIKIPSKGDFIKITTNYTSFKDYNTGSNYYISGASKQNPFFAIITETLADNLAIFMYKTDDGTKHLVADYSNRGGSWQLWSPLDQVDKLNQSLDTSEEYDKYDAVFKEKQVDEDHLPIIGDIIKLNQDLTLKSLGQDERQFKSGSYANIVLITNDKKYLAIKSGLFPSKSEPTYYIELNQNDEHSFSYQTLTG